MDDQQTGNHWLRLKLIGSQSNRDAIGAEITVYLPEAVLRQQVMPTCSYLSQSELPVTFGLGRHERVERVTIRWPSGKLTDLSDVAADRTVVLDESDAKS